MNRKTMLFGMVNFGDLTREPMFDISDGRLLVETSSVSHPGNQAGVQAKTNIGLDDSVSVGQHGV